MRQTDRQTNIIQTRLCSENKPLGNLRLPRGNKTRNGDLNDAACTRHLDQLKLGGNKRE